MSPSSSLTWLVSAWRGWRLVSGAASIGWLLRCPLTIGQWSPPAGSLGGLAVWGHLEAGAASPLAGGGGLVMLTWTLDIIQSFSELYLSFTFIVDEVMSGIQIQGRFDYLCKLQSSSQSFPIWTLTETAQFFLIGSNHDSWTDIKNWTWWRASI